MTKVTDLFPPKWLRPEHLRNQTHRVAIEAVTVEKLFNPRSRQHEDKIVLAFHGKSLRLPLNKTQAFSLAAITATPEIEQWIGHEVMLAPGVAPNKAATIVIARTPTRPPADDKADQGGETQDEEDTSTT